MNTSTQPNNHRWLRKWLRLEPHQPIGAEGEPPYLLRWYVIPRNRWLNVYLHKFLRDDEDRALHDHPWWFVSVVLRGSYTEMTPTRERRRRAGSIAFRPAEWRHRVILDKTLEEVGELEAVGQRPPRVRLWNTGRIPCWTLIITGRRRRLWGFWCRRLVDTWSADTYDDLDTVVASTDGQVEVERFIPWDEFGAAGCGEPVRSDR